MGTKYGELNSTMLSTSLPIKFLLTGVDLLSFLDGQLSKIVQGPNPATHRYPVAVTSGIGVVVDIVALHDPGYPVDAATLDVFLVRLFPTPFRLTIELDSSRLPASSS